MTFYLNLLDYKGVNIHPVISIYICYVIVNTSGNITLCPKKEVNIFMLFEQFSQNTVLFRNIVCRYYEKDSTRI